MDYQGMTELLAMYVIACGGEVVTNGRHWIIRFGSEQIICATPKDEAIWTRLVGDLVAAGLPWPPITGS